MGRDQGRGIGRLEHEWAVWQLKDQGYRIVARKDGAIVRLWSRNGVNWAIQFPMIVDAIRRLPVERIVLDGEAVCLRPDGHPDFRALRSRQACPEARLMVFDLLGLDGHP